MEDTIAYVTEALARGDTSEGNDCSARPSSDPAREMEKTVPGAASFFGIYDGGSPLHGKS